MHLLARANGPNAWSRGVAARHYLRGDSADAPAGPDGPPEPPQGGARVADLIFAQAGVPRSLAGDRE